MIIGFLCATIAALIWKSWLLSLLVFHIATGIRKASLWVGLPFDYRPKVLWRFNPVSFLLTAVFWPLIVIRGGDPVKAWFRDIESGKSYNPFTGER